MKDVILVTVAEGSSKHVIHDDAETTLETLSEALSNDNTSELHKSILYEAVLRNQLIPLLLAVRFETQAKLLSSIIRVLCQLTAQFSALNIAEDKDTAELRETYNEYLAKVKDEFNEPRFTWPLLKYLKIYTAQKKDDKSQISVEEVTDCIRLVKNLLEIREYEPTTTAAALIAQLQRPSKQNSFIWYLLYQNFDAILLSLIHEHRWSKVVAEIIRLMFNNVDIDILKKSLQDWMISNTISSSEHTYPGTSELSRSRSNSSSNGSNPTHFKDSKYNKKGKEREKSKPGNSEVGSISPRNASHQTHESKTNIPDKASDSKESHLFLARLSGKSNSSISEHSATLGIEEENDIEIGHSERLNEDTVGASISNKRPRESDHDDDDPPPKREKIKPEGRGDWIEKLLAPQKQKYEKERKRKSKSERDQIYKDLGFSSGITDQNSSGSEPLEPENWRVRVSDLSDHGYASYLTDQMEKKSRKQLPFEKLTEQEKRERRKKFIEQRMTKKNVKLLTLPYDVVTESDVMDILSDFSLDFLIKGYGVLTLDLLHEMSKEETKAEVREKDNYSWLLYFFLPLAAEIDIPFNMIQITYEVFHYIAGETIHNGLEILFHEGVPEENMRTLTGYLQAQRCFMEVLSLYEQNSYLESIERYNLKLIILQIVRTRNIHQHYIFLIRLASIKNMLQKQYLENLVVANHIHLTKMQQLNTSFSESEMTTHIKHFALPEMMKPYGFLLENFRENSATLNDCIFTMMHHVAGDLVCPQALDIKPIPETIQQIVKQNVSLCDDWQDLIEYMMNYYRFKMKAEGRSSKGSRKDNDSSTCSQTSKISQDKATQTSKLQKANSSISASSLKVAVGPDHSPTGSQSLKTDPSPGIFDKDNTSDGSSSTYSSQRSIEKTKQRKDDIKKILDILKACNLSYMISWLQVSLLDLWRVKLYLAPNQTVSNPLVRNFIPLEPVPWYYANRVHEVPLVPFSSKICKKLEVVHFQHLLKKLGLISLPKRPAIPISFTSREILEIAVLLGPVENKDLYPELLGEDFDY